MSNCSECSVNSWCNYLFNFFVILACWWIGVISSLFFKWVPRSWEGVISIIIMGFIFGYTGFAAGAIFVGKIGDEEVEE